MLEAQELLAHLNGGARYSGPSIGFPLEKGQGHCRVCGQYGPLTFEHIPPRAAGNATRRRFVDTLRWAEQEDLAPFPRTGWKPLQRGHGAYLLCSSCNRRPSHKGYVRAYTRAAAAAMRRLAERTEEKNDFFAPVDVELHEVDVGGVVRQVMAMMLCLSGSAALGDAHPSLRELVLDGAPCSLPAGFRLEWGLTFGGRCRATLPVATISDTGHVSAEIGLSFAPFVWVLRYRAGTPCDPLADVSSWTTLRAGDVTSLEARTTVVPTVSPFPSDHRTTEELQPDVLVDGAERHL